MDFKKQIKPDETAKNIAKLVEKNGYDDAIIILRKDQEVGIAVSDTNSQFAPYMLDGLYNELNERNKIVFAMNLLNIDIDGGYALVCLSKNNIIGRYDTLEELAEDVKEDDDTLVYAEINVF